MKTPQDLSRRNFLALPIAGIVLPAALAAATDARTPAPAEGPVDFHREDAAPGTFPERWICGSEAAMDNVDLPVQVHWYNEHTVVLRQNKCYSYEAPFMMLYFGNQRVLMVDQGFTTLPNQWPLYHYVEDCIAAWSRNHGKRPEDMELLLAFSHLHIDHYAAQNQFDTRPNTRRMGLTHEEMVGFWGMTNYPEERVTLDLGGREVWIWGSPGHVMSEFAYYDTYTQILFTGDMFYRGRCYISFWQPWFDSMTRIIKFLDEHPVVHIVGCHVEMGRHGEDYPYGVTWQPDEAPWQLSVAELRHAYEVAKGVTKPGIYYTGGAGTPGVGVYLCNQTRGYTTIDTYPYLYDEALLPAKQS